FKPTLAAKFVRDPTLISTLRAREYFSSSIARRHPCELLGRRCTCKLRRRRLLLPLLIGPSPFFPLELSSKLFLLSFQLIGSPLLFFCSSSLVVPPASLVGRLAP